MRSEFIERTNVQECRIKLSAKQSQAWALLNDNIKTEILYGGAAGGGKTMLGCIWQIVRRVKYPETRGAIVRSGLKRLRQSTLVTFFKCAKDMGYVSGVHFMYNSVLSTFRFVNGSTITLVDLSYKPSDPDYQSFGSVEYTDIFMDEAGELPERGVDVLKSRIRYKLAEYDLTPKLLMCSNPHDGWLKKTFVKDNEGNIVKLKSHQAYVQAKLSDNPDRKFAEIYEMQLKSLNSEYDRARLLDGDWDAHPRTGKEYYFPFSYDKHVTKEAVFNPQIASHLTFDFNSSPYMTMFEIQIWLNKGVWMVDVIDEYCYEHPLNTTHAVVSAYKEKRFRDLTTFYYYGDYSGRNPTTATTSPDIRHNYDVVELILGAKANNNSNRVIPNQNVLRRKEFVLDILLGRLPIQLRIHPSCRNLINEMTYMKELPSGAKHVEMTKDEATGKMYERFGHTTDALEYFLTSCFQEIYETYKRR